MLFKGKSPTPKGSFWALRNVSFDVAAGRGRRPGRRQRQRQEHAAQADRRRDAPRRGHGQVRGGVAPLIELTGGFVGDLTARDNIWLTAGLHGLSKAQIDERFDEIVDFAEIEDFLDTPFRHFSSGMQVRLGFSVITTLDEPIVLVDEVLAVGDKRFREKCYKRMDEIIAEGRPCSWSRTARPTCAGSAPAGLYLRAGRADHRRADRRGARRTTTPTRTCDVPKDDRPHQRSERSRRPVGPEGRGAGAGSRSSNRRRSSAWSSRCTRRARTSTSAWTACARSRTPTCEIVVIDDGSTDGSAEICARHAADGCPDPGAPAAERRPGGGPQRRDRPRHRHVT